MLIRKLIFYFLIIVFTIAIVNISFAQEKAVDALYKDGLKKYVLGEYESAITDFESALKLDPKNIKVQNMYFTTLVKLGNIEYSKGNLQKAKEYYEKALKISSGSKTIKDKLVEINNLIGEQKTKEKEALIEKTPAEKAPAKGEVVSKSEGASNLSKVMVAGKLPEAPETTSQELQTPKEAASLKGKGIRPSGIVSGVKATQTAQKTQKIQFPFDIEKFIEKQNEENRKMLDSIVKAQREERQAFLNENRKMVNRIIEAQDKERKNLVEHIKTLTTLQQEERNFFSRSLLLIVGGGIIVILMIITAIFLFVRRLARANRPRITPEYTVGIAADSYIKEIPEMIDESRLITDERYSDIVKAKRLKELYLEFKNGDPSWDSIQEYITEVNSDIKDEILDVVEKKLEESGGKNYEQAYKVLMPLVTDGNANIRERSKGILARITNSNVSGYLESSDKQTENNPLSIPSLMGMANVADMKTGRPKHSIMVAEAALSISEALNDKDVSPDEAYKVGLAHDIGYMELPGSIFKENRNLTEEEFEIIKTHPVKGVNLLSNAVQLPQIFMDGIKYHHERMDGSGYPEGLEGNAIPLIARIIAVSDFFIAVTSSRLYRSALPVDEAIKLLKSLSNKVLDKNIVDIFIDIIKRQEE